VVRGSPWLGARAPARGTFFQGKWTALRASEDVPPKKDELHRELLHGPFDWYWLTLQGKMRVLRVELLGRR